SDFFRANASVQALPGEHRKVKRKNFSLRKENPLTGIDECHITTRCSKDSSRKGRRPRFEKNHGLRFRMTTIILRVAKSQNQNQIDHRLWQSARQYHRWRTVRAEIQMRVAGRSQSSASCD